MRPNLLNLFLTLAILLVITACVCQSDRNSETSSAPASNQAAAAPTTERETAKAARPESKKSDDGDFIVEHLDVNDARYLEIDRQVKSEKLLEKAADKLNRALILPNDLYLRTKDCKEVNAFYNSNDQSVTVCYELMEHFYKVFRGAGNAKEAAYRKMFAAVQFVFLHEIGHALINIYKLPVMGNEEDAADRCSAYINLEELGDEGVQSVLAAADAFAIESKRNSPAGRNMADEHLLQEQRFYNSFCMIYGSNADQYASFVADGYLPKERAARCSNEYQKTVESWVNLLSDWRKS